MPEGDSLCPRSRPVLRPVADTRDEEAPEILRRVLQRWRSMAGRVTGHGGEATSRHEWISGQSSRQLPIRRLFPEDTG